MRHFFKEWYAPTADELAQLWQKATFVLDSNVLLGLYQYPPATLEEFLKVLERVQDRLWLPHLAGSEYHRNRAKSLPQQRLVLERLVKRIEELSGNLETLGLPEYHPVLNLAAVEGRRQSVKEAFDALLQEVRTALEGTPEFKPETVLQGEPVRDRVTKLFEGRVGAPLSDGELQQTYKEGVERYARETPPGYKDRTKEEPTRYGDLIIWKEILKRQKVRPEGDRGVIFVTSERKEDWWLRKEDLLLGPRPELVREYLNEVGGDFFMYSPAEFLKNAPQYLQLVVSPAAIADVRRISEASPVVTVLRYQRMALPESAVRVLALARIYDSLLSGQIQRAGDLNTVIEGVGEEYGSNYVAAPLFFSLISQSYGPLRVEADPLLRLRDRRIQLADTNSTKESFVRLAHAAWLAQALFRVRYEAFADEDLLGAFFGEDYGDEAVALLKQARALVERDVAYRGR